MSWFFIALLAPALWAGCNYIDKFLLNRYFKEGGEGALFIFSSLIGILILPVMILVFPEVLSQPWRLAMLITLNGVFYVLSLVPYVYALKKGDTSLIIPMFQAIPFFTIVFAWLILGETVRMFDFLGGLLIIAGSIVLSLEMSETKTLRFNYSAFCLMMLSSLSAALTFIFFKYFALDAPLPVVIFWEYVGFAVVAVCFYLIPVYRRQFYNVLKMNTSGVLTLNGINEVVNLIGKFAFNYASLLVPIALIWFVVGLQPVFVLMYGLVLTVLFPQIIKEQISRNHLLHRVACIAVMLVGTYILYL